MEKYKIFTYVDQITEAYQESVEIVDGLTFDQRKTLRTIEYYTNSEYLSGNKDGLGREKPFYNIGNYRVTVAKTATDLDVKDIRFEPDSLKFSTQTMVINKELYKYLKESNFSLTLNEMGVTRPKYGGVLVKKYQDSKELKINVVDWKNVTVDPVDILGGTIIETHWMLPSEVADKSDVWENTDEVLKAHAKYNKNKPCRIEVKEVTGEFSYSFDPDSEDTDANDTKFKSMCFYIACIGNKKYLLYKEDIKTIKDKYRYLAWERLPGRGLGRGVIEDGFEAQVWTNDTMIAYKNVMDISGKVILSTDSQKISGNAIVGVDNGHIFQMEPNRKLESLNLAPSSMPQFEEMINLWNIQYDRASSTFDANTGEQPPSGTPYSQTALLNQVANSPFEYRREEWGIFLNELLNDWMLPFVKKRLIKGHDLVADYDDDELDLIDQDIATLQTNDIIKERLLAGETVTPEEQAEGIMAVKESLRKTGKKREMKIPEGWLDVQGNITANITGELKNKSAMLQSLDSVFKTVVSTFNPNTGQYAALQDPVLSKIFGQIVEMAGIPFSAGQLRPSQTAPMQSPEGADMSAISPVPSTAPAV